MRSIIGAALEAGIVRDAIIAQSQREASELWSVRDSPGRVATQRALAAIEL